MKFEVLKKSHKKQVIIGISILILIGIVLIVKSTFAKYELVKSIKIAEGTINYKLPDFKIMAMYKNDGDSYTEIDTMPESGYIINDTKSYCTLDNINKDEKAKLFTNEEGRHVISGLSKSSKCYLYFDKVKSAGDIILENVTVKLATPDFSKTSCNNGCRESTVGIYQAKDNDGWSYYYRGDVEDNYVKFAGFYWRIIRVNGDGSIRLIYDGTSAHQNGEETTDSIAVSNQKFSHNIAYWNSETDSKFSGNNAYVGFKYTLNQIHGLGTKSNVLEQLEKWYTNNLSSYESKIDINAGFCGDRAPSTSHNELNNLGGIGTTQTYYGAFIRLTRSTKAPSLYCSSEDLYTVSDSLKGNKALLYPIGLITVDEISMAGGLYTNDNYGYYLYNGQSYWTLSPAYHYSNPSHKGARVFAMHNKSFNAYQVYNTFGIRPVINLRSDTKFKFTGTDEKGAMSNPYVVN